MKRRVSTRSDRWIKNNRLLRLVLAINTILEQWRTTQISTNTIQASGVFSQLAICWAAAHVICGLKTNMSTFRDDSWTIFSKHLIISWETNIVYWWDSFVFIWESGLLDALWTDDLNKKKSIGYQSSERHEQFSTKFMKQGLWQAERIGLNVLSGVDLVVVIYTSKKKHPFGL